MAFNSGGTNVGGVKSRPQGEFVIPAAQALSITGTGNFSVDFTVPTGKVWNLKSYLTESVSFIGTITSNYKILNIGANGITLENSGSTVSCAELIGDKDLWASAGDYVRILINVSAYTSGDINSRISYQEMDA